MNNLSENSHVLVTGGAGYIGSHTVVELLANNQSVTIIDNLCNSSINVLDRVQELSRKRLEFVKGDIRDKQFLEAVFAARRVDAVVHFAGLKAVGESVERPLSYYQNNVAGSLNLFEVMATVGCEKLVFSSSATVYGDPASVPITEDFPLSATNPYGQTKLMIEEILRDLYQSNPSWQISILRYFNPVAAHPSGLIGEDPNGIPNNLMPYIAQVGVGRRSELTIHGNDYSTADGTGVRDYIHVVDLANAHLAALNALNKDHGCQAYNIGTGRGYSVLEMVAAFEKASGKTIAYSIGPRRHGDIAACYANPIRANSILHWQAQYGLEDMMKDQWRWQSKNPTGYE